MSLNRLEVVRRRGSAYSLRLLAVAVGVAVTGIAGSTSDVCGATLTHSKSVDEPYQMVLEGSPGDSVGFTRSVEVPRFSADLGTLTRVTETATTLADYRWEYDWNTNYSFVDLSTGTSIRTGPNVTPLASVGYVESYAQPDLPHSETDPEDSILTWQSVTTSGTFDLYYGNANDVVQKYFLSSVAAGGDHGLFTGTALVDWNRTLSVSMNLQRPRLPVAFPATRSLARTG
jgi:hypothetical protein